MSHCSDMGEDSSSAVCRPSGHSPDEPGGRPLNCWEYMDCGRGPQSTVLTGIEPCPAAQETVVDGVNRGFNGGRSCWAVVGTFAMDLRPDPAIGCRHSCLECEFFGIVVKEELSKLTITPWILERLGYANIFGPELAACIDYSEVLTTQTAPPTK